MKKNKIQKYQEEQFVGAVVITMKVPASLYVWIKSNKIKKKKVFVERCKELGWKE